jgi:hypothetical protein
MNIQSLVTWWSTPVIHPMLCKVTRSTQVSCFPKVIAATPFWETWVDVWSEATPAERKELRSQHW